MRTLVLMVLGFAGCGLAFEQAALAEPPPIVTSAPTTARSRMANPPPTRVLPTRGQVVYRSAPCPTTACRRNQGWVPYYRDRLPPPGAECRPPTWRAPYYKRANYRSSWYGPRCYTRRSAACATRSAYYQKVMGR